VQLSFEIVHTDLANPWILAFYMLGVISAAYHFGYGLWSFGIHWGITVSEQSQRLSQWVCAAIGFAVLTVGLISTLAFL
jgi:succinate dehydrogenase / fumarate reductase cytochrome b subunit